MHDKIVTGRQIVYPQGDAFPLCFLCTFHLTPHESPCTSSVTAQLSETSKSHSTASLVLLRSFKRGARAATSTSNRVLRGSKVEPLEPQPVQHTDCNPPIGLERLTRQSENCTKDEFGRGDVDFWRSPAPATWCNCANEAGPWCEKQNLDVGVNKPRWKWHFAGINSWNNIG